MSTSTVTSLDGFHAAGFAQRADELVRAYFDAVNVEDSARIDELLARSFLSYDVHGNSPVPPRATAGCIARIMRKSNRARPTSDAPLLLL
jgi:hypothetical protein